MLETYKGLSMSLNLETAMPIKVSYRSLKGLGFSEDTFDMVVDNLSVVKD